MGASKFQSTITFPLAYNFEPLPLAKLLANLYFFSSRTSTHAAGSSLKQPDQRNNASIKSFLVHRPHAKHSWRGILIITMEMTIQLLAGVWESNRTHYFDGDFPRELQIYLMCFPSSCLMKSSNLASISSRHCARWSKTLSELNLS